jgi:phenylpropionate dioxygenase-like ring-hydroxylating dioxygenase large terminal subunit
MTKASPTIIASSNDVYENFMSLYRPERDDPPASVLEQSTDDIPLHTVSTTRYTSQEFHEREVREVWHKVWQVACWGGDIPNAGDTSLYDNAGISAVIVRQNDGTVKAFYNSCLHRGMRLCNTQGSRASLKCRFHGYTWGLDGKCTNLPHAWDFPNLDQENLPLPELAVGEWQGFIFVHPDASARPLEAYLGSMPAQWEAAGWSLDSRFKAIHVTKKIRANWKVAQEAFMEGYHAPAVHPDTIMPAGPFELIRADIFPGEPHFSRGLGSSGVIDVDGENSIARQQAAVDHYVRFYTPEFSARDDLVVTDANTARDIMHRLAVEKARIDNGADLSNMARFDVIDFCWYNVFPNFMPWPTLGYPLAYWFRPIDGPNTCTMDILFLLPHGDTKPPSAQCIDLDYDDPCEPYLGAVGTILDEDMANLPIIQQGLESSKSGVVNLSEYFESRIRHFHSTLGRYVGDDS